MDPIDFICGLMRQNTNALGFIPRPALITQFVKRDRYILQLNRSGAPIGYLLHGPKHPDGHMNISQACIELDKRNRGFGSAVVQNLLRRAGRARATYINLRCACDLDASSFWIQAGFIPIAIVPGGRRRKRNIVCFRHTLAGPPKFNARLASIPGAPPLQTI